MIQIVDKIELMILTGYTDAQASKLIRKAKQKLLGVELSAKHDIINPVLEDTVNE